MSTVNYTGDCEGRNVIGWQETAGDMDILCLDCAGEDPGENHRPLTERDFRDDEIVTCDNIINNSEVCGNRVK